MQLASYGTRALPGRFLTRLLPRNPPGAARSIHIGPLPRPTPTGSVGTTAQKVVQQTRNVLTSFLAHLTAPGLRAPNALPTTARSMHTGTHTGFQGIRSNLSLPVRHALSRGPYLPRPPTIPRTTMQVGLGTARNFSSARPIFQNLAQNVPIAGRAFWEADFDSLKMRDECRVKIGKGNSYKPQEQLKEMIKPTNASLLFAPAKTEVADSVSEAASELEHYFPTATPAVAGLATYLLIPLAPTPASRLPLSMSPLPPMTRRETERLLPLPELASLHSSHSTHALRVSSLFARLDTANVWNKGVSCDAYSSGAHAHASGGGVCTILRVSFAGWCAAEVRGVIGESGTGWCELYEARSPFADAESEVEVEDEASAFGDQDSVWTPSHDGGAQENEMDPSQSFVLPTLDFSSSFIAAHSPAPTPPLSRAPSEIDMLSYASPLRQESDAEWEEDVFSDGGSSEESWVQPSVHGSTRFGLGFSSDFARRLSSEGSREPRAML